MANDDDKTAGYVARVEGVLPGLVVIIEDPELTRYVAVVKGVLSDEDSTGYVIGMAGELSGAVGM